MFLRRLPRHATNHQLKSRVHEIFAGFLLAPESTSKIAFYITVTHFLLSQWHGFEEVSWRAKALANRGFYDGTPWINYRLMLRASGLTQGPFGDVLETVSRRDWR